MNKDHFNCHVCGEKYKHIYYKEYKQLEDHFDKTHFLCPDPNCKAMTYVVFKSAEELTLHNLTVHQRWKYDEALQCIVGFGKFKN